MLLSLTDNHLYCGATDALDGIETEADIPFVVHCEFEV